LTFKIGFHVSIVGGIQNSISNAVKIGCTAFQIFARNPRGWLDSGLTESETETESFRSNLKKGKIQRDCIAVNMLFLVNLSGPDGELHKNQWPLLQMN
jgi:deoxyribonuclease IV